MGLVLRRSRGTPRLTDARRKLAHRRNRDVARERPMNITDCRRGGRRTLALSPADFEKLIADETEKWIKLVRAANIKQE